MCGSGKFCQRGSNSDALFFSLVEARARMAFRWHANDGTSLNGSFVFFLWDPDQYCKETLYYCDFSGGGWGGLDPLSPSGFIFFTHKIDT